MTATLADSLALVLPHAPGTLVPRVAHAHLGRLAEQLAPVHRAGFEVRLGAASDVDFQQGIQARDDEAAVLRRHMRARGDTTLDAFLERWDDPGSPLYDGIDELWLEFDRPPSSALSVFVGFPRRTEGAPGRRLLAHDALDLLAGRAAWQPFAPALDACFEALPDGAVVGHVGLMLGRPAPFLRVNVKRLGGERTEVIADRAAAPADSS